MSTIILAGGGTGGHVYPAISIGDELRERGHTVERISLPRARERPAAPAAAAP